MQHMQMREWFLDRISAKFGVTAVFQTGGANSPGMSQSLEIVVANRSTERLQNVFEDVFIPAVVGQLQLDGWTIGLEKPEEEDEQAEAQRIGRELQNAQIATGLGREVEWTREGRADIKPGFFAVEGGEEEEGMMGALMGGGGAGSPTPMEGDAGGQTTPEGGRPNDPNEMGGGPREPQDPSTENPMARSNDAVSSGDAGGPGEGYRNAVYGGSDDELEDYLTHVQAQLDSDDYDADTKKSIVESARKVFDESDIDITSDTVEQYAAEPTKTFQDMRKFAGDGWRGDYIHNDIVRQMYDVIEQSLE